MKAIILAGGQSKRLLPLTTYLPKCLLKIGEKTLIDRQINSLKTIGIKETIIITGFQADKLKKHLIKNHPDKKLTFIFNEKYLETYPAYGLWLAKKYLKNDVIYLNADVLYDQKIIHSIANYKGDSATAIQKVAWDEEEVNVIINKKNEVIEIGKHISKDLSYGEFIGVTKLGKKFNQNLIKALDYFVKNKELKKFAADAINLSIQRGSTMHCLDVGQYKAMEIDNAEDYKNAKKLWKNYEKHLKQN